MNKIISKNTKRLRISFYYEGFTIIEIIIYCAIFVTFAVSVIESMIWVNAKMSMQDRLAEVTRNNTYKIYFASIYKRYKMDNPKIEVSFPEMISSSSIIKPELEEDYNLGVVLNQIQSGSVADGVEGGFLGKEKYKVTFFDSILTP